MASKNIAEAEKQEELQDITTCCICTNVYTEPKALPCIHTFCMKCLQENGLKTNKGPGEEMPCPICRQLFKIPTEGFSALPKNFFMDRLIKVSKVSVPLLESCSLCQLEIMEEFPAADVYCFDCKQKFCAKCCIEHSKYKLTKSHKLIPISEYECVKNEMVCEIHEQRVLDVFCADCQTVVCAICFIEEHNSHDGSHVNKCVDSFRKQIENNTEAVNECICLAQMKKAELVKVKAEIQQMVERVMCNVEERNVEIKKFADEQACCLKQGLYSELQSRLKEIQLATDDIDAHILKLETYNSNCQRLLDKRSDSDICRQASDLSVRATQLQQHCQPVIEQAIRNFKLCFRQSELEEFLEEDCGNLIGEIEGGDLKPKMRRKQILLEEQSKEIDMLRQEAEELREERTNYKRHEEKLMQKLETNEAEIKTLQVSNNRLKEEIDALETTNKSLTICNEEEKAEYRAQIETLMKELDTNNDEIVALQACNDKLREEIEALEATNNSLKMGNEEEKADYEAHIKTLMKELDTNNTEIMALQASNDKLKKEIEALEATNNSLKMGNEEEKADYEAHIKTLMMELDTNNTEIMALQASNDKLKKEIEALEATNNSLRISNDEEKAELRAQIETLMKEQDTSNAEIMQLQDSNNKLKDEVEALATTNSALKISNDKEKADYETRIETKLHELETNKTEIKALQVSNDKLKEEVDALKATNNSLKTINDKLVEELRLCKATVKTVGTNAEGLEMLEAGHMTNDELKRRIKTNYYAQFISQVDPDMLGDCLKPQNILTIDQWKTITAGKLTAKDKCREVLDFLLTCDHPSAFLVVRQVLEKENHHLLKTITKQELDPRPSAANKESLYNREQSLVQQDQQLPKKCENCGEQPCTEASLRASSRVRGSIPSQTPDHRSAKGPVSIVDATSDFITIENNGRKKENLSDWFVKKSVNGLDNAQFKIPRGTVVKPRSNFKFSTRDLRPINAHSTERDIPEASVGQCKEVVITLHKPCGDVRASITQRIVNT